MGQDTCSPEEGSRLLICSPVTRKLRGISRGCDDGHGGDTGGGPKLRGIELLWH